MELHSRKKRRRKRTKNKMVSKDIAHNNMRILEENFPGPISVKLLEQIESYICNIEDQLSMCKCELLRVRAEADRLHAIIDDLKMQLAESRRDR